MYTLYKNPVQPETLAIVQYLHSRGISLQPNLIVERNYPSFVTQLPSIYYMNNLYSGLWQVIQFYESMTGISNLLTKANNFKANCPSYRIHK